MTPPRNIAAEQSVLGTAITYPDSIDDAVGVLSPGDFYEDCHQVIWRGLVWLRDRGRTVDLMALRHLLDEHGKLDAAGGDTYLSGLLDHGVTAAAMEEHARIVRETAQGRAVLAVLQSGIHEAGSGAGSPTEHASRLILALEEIAADRERNPVQSIADTLPGVITALQRQARDGRTITGVPTGYPDLDDRTAGLQPGDLVIVAGRPSMGKTAIALNMAEHAAQVGYPVLFFSLEMSADQLDRRVLGARAGVPSHHLRFPRQMTDDDWGRITECMEHVSALPIWIDDSAEITVPEIRARARRVMARQEIAVVVVDYLQIVRSATNEQSRERELARMSAGLKAMAKELRVPVVVLSQLNRSCEARQDKRPMMSDLRESGAIEQDADLVLMLYRDAVYKDGADPEAGEVLVRKNRNGPIGTVRLRWRGELTRWENYADGETPTEPEERPAPWEEGGDNDL